MLSLEWSDNKSANAIIINNNDHDYKGLIQYYTFSWM